MFLSRNCTNLVSKLKYTATLKFGTRRFGTSMKSPSEQKLSIESVIAAVEKSPKPMVKLAAIDIDGIPRGKYVNKDKFVSALKNGSAFCSVIFGWDCADVLYDNTKEVGWHMGYGDFDTSIDHQTFRQVPWEGDTPFFLMDFLNKKTGEGLPVCPRNLLRDSIKKLDKEGYKATVGVEYEFFNYRESPQSLQAKNYVNPEPLTPGMFGYSLLRTGRNREYFTAMMDQLPKFGIPIEGIHTETGPGVYEAAIQCCDAMEAADRGFLFKMAVKDIARDFGVIPTFMAKPSSKLPGCGGHMHVSLADKNTGQPMFYQESDPDKMSDVMKHFVAGQMYCLPQIMPMYAPTINSYKRFVEGYWAPTTATWGVENRTVSYRVIGGGPKSLRVEVRIPGADVNPYLGVTAALMSGLYGIQNKLKLPERVGGSAYGTGKVDPKDILPRNLHEAATRMNESRVARELFGNEFVDHFTATRVWEWRQYQTAVTNWEIERYFEII